MLFKRLNHKTTKKEGENFSLDYIVALHWLIMWIEGCDQIEVKRACPGFTLNNNKKKADAT